MVRTTLFGMALAMAAQLAAAATAEEPPVEPRDALARAAAYLWSQQADDGGWHSGQYAVLRSGQALTPFVLHALLSIPEEMAPRPDGGVNRALQFIRAHVDEHGALGRADPDVLEYPVYSTAYALRCLVKVGNPEDRALMEQMAQFLLDAQFDESEGFDRNDLAYGGWGFDVARAAGDPGHMDLAHTRRALEALADARRAGVIADSHGYVNRAREFLDIVQKASPLVNSSPRQPPIDGRPTPISLENAAYDGGFYFSPVVLAANKGRTDDEPVPHWRSYATATCDGILALVAGGSPGRDVRVVAASTWLRDHSNLQYPQGIPADYPEPWGEAVKFYHFAVRAEAYRALDWDLAERRQLAELVARRQRPDGSFVNADSPLMKEDDPVMCTALAVVALANCR